jgi:hypothetical protein
MRNAEKISHTVGLLNPESALLSGRVPVTKIKVTARRRETPIGAGRTTKARIVATKIASKWR